MKNVVNRAFMAKKRFLYVTVVLLMSVMTVQANDYMEQERHYSTRTGGADCIHFTIPVWAAGAYDYYAVDESYVYFKLTGSDEKVVISHYKTEDYGENDKENGRGSAWMKLENDKGEIVVTSMASGVNQHIPSGDWTEKLIVKQRPDDGYDYVTFLEFDWYPHQDLSDTTFVVGVHSVFERSYTHGNRMEKNFDLGQYKGAGNDMMPQLFSPYLYQVNETGMTGYGYAAIPYSTFYSTIGYTMSAQDTTFHKNTSRSDNIFIMTADSVQSGFYVDFLEYRNEELGTTMTQRSNKIDIPAYHRIYEFGGTEEVDSTLTYTGNIELHWNVKYPDATDLIEDDYFEVQRALKSDYSDAQTIQLVALSKGEDKGNYSFLDDSRDTWTGNVDPGQDSLQANVCTKLNDFVLLDENDQMIATLDLTLTANKLYSPGIEIYYRVRRASSSVWGWDHEFAETMQIGRHNYLAPLAENQAPYTKDDDFDMNHKVHFSFVLENREVQLELPKPEDCTLSYDVKKEKSENISLEFATTPLDGDKLHTEVYCTLYDEDNNKIKDEWKVEKSQTVEAKRGGKLQLRYRNHLPDQDTTWINDFLSLDKSCKVTLKESYFNPMLYGYEYYSLEYKQTSSMQYSPDIDKRIEALNDSLKQMMIDKMQGEVHDQLGRCMWDRTARLVLVRSSEEDPGSKMELVIPQDSIVRQADGSWLASFTDAADRPCTHYTYAVRIDQSSADLHVQDSVQLQPMTVTGPSLYYDDAASIQSFTATQGATATEFKRGVMLTWTPSSNAVDDYVLTRRTDSTAVADTLYNGVEALFFDQEAVPNVIYQYTVTARYSCNGRHSENSKTVQGWRTPYGEISGHVIMPDNSGMPGVKVDLLDLSDSTVVKSITTNAAGYYRFDSIDYGYLSPVKMALEHKKGEGAGDPSEFVEIRVEDSHGELIQDWKNLEAGEYTFPMGAVIRGKSIYEAYEDHDSITLTGPGTVLCQTFKKEVEPQHFTLFFELSFTKDSTAQPLPTSKDFAVIPSDAHAQFSYNYTSASTADITLANDNAVATGVDFMSTNTVRLTGRALFHLSTVPVAGAMFILNGDTVHRGNVPLVTATDGNFEMALIQGKTYTLQMFKPGHTFLNDGYLEVEEGKQEFALEKALDGVRFYDQTKVRLAGRVAGGNIQRDLPTGFGLGKNNLGDNVMLVLQLEGDNTAQLIHDPDDLSRDTMKNVINQIVYSTDTLSADPERIVGQTSVLIEKKRIIIFPDSKTGEYVADLFPTKYKVVQATANGYATLLPSGQGMETFDLTNAPVTSYDPKIDADSVHYNAVYDRIYHTPVQVHLHQMINGLPKPGYGEEKIELSSLDPNQHTQIALYHQLNTGRIHYVLGYPLFFTNRKYQFTAEAYEVYRYNNSDAAAMDTVPWHGGEVIVRNGMQINSTPQTFPLDENGRNNNIFLDIDNIEVESSGTDALRVISVALNAEGNVVESDQIEGFVIGSTTGVGALESTETDIQLLDIVRDPGGSGSSSWIESGSSYSFSYKTQLNLKVGVNLQPSWGTDVNMHVGLFTGAPAGGGTYSGEPIQAESKFAFDLPIVFEWDNGWDYNYTFSTSDRISTSSRTTLPTYVGSNADVFVGASISRVVNKVRSVVVINDSLYEMRKPAIEAGAMKVLATGVDNQMNRYHLVTGEVISAGMHVYRTFAYTQYYIMETVIPQMALRRYNLLMNFPDSAAAKAAANAKGEPVYWYHNDAPDQYPEYYSMILPDGDGVFTDQVAAYDNMITSWTALLVANEKEKVEARTKGTLLGTYSVSDGTSYTHTDSYGASVGYNEVPVGGGLTSTLLGIFSTGGGTAVLNTVGNAIKNLWNLSSLTQSTVGKTMAQALDDFYNNNNGNKTKKTDQEIGTKSNGWEFHMNYTPVADMSYDVRQSKSGGQSHSHGFTIAPDPMGDLTVSVYRAELDSAWKADTKDVRESTDLKDNDDVLYGSYVFYTVAGSTYCPHEEEEYTQFYNPGTSLNSGTLWIHKPELTADAYEKTNVDPNTRATFRIKLANGGQLDTGFATKGASFQLTLDGASNPDGAKVYINGAPLIQNLWYWILPDEPITQTIEVERGTVDDYNLNFIMYVEDCARTRTDMSLGVHFLPESSPVNIALPRPNWVMNTLSPRDSTGYYLPIEIDGFDLHHKNFDHIEFQYKLSSESEERWVNLCSFYASDSLYELASGNKAMIENGRIPPFRFYGERDPMEQKYDLRAVTFCRYGSGYVHKSSAVMSGIKDTRPPRVFGRPEPANSVLSVDKNLSLRFNEAIAGNYLDEDNNFRIVGVTNETGIATTTALQFDGSNLSFAATKLERHLNNHPLTVDMMVLPADPNREEVFFSHGDAGQGLVFGKSADNRLYIQVGNGMKIYSQSIGDPILAFTRVAFTLDYQQGVNFYVGTLNITDTTQTVAISDYHVSAPFIFGKGFNGSMLEPRVWTKALNEEEIAATYNRYLTGYERELLAYYHMNEGKGETVTDYAHGATLYLEGCTWQKKQGYALYLNNETAQLDGNLLSRSTTYDETLMFWFRTAGDGTLFSANRTEPTDSTAAKGTSIAIEDGNIVFKSGNQKFEIINQKCTDGAWHHFVLTINRTFDNASVFIDGEMLLSFAASYLSGISGAMYLGGDGFVGHIDEFAVFEQALPRTLIESSDEMAFVGDEMGLMGYLPFEEIYQNSSGVLQQRFSVNDQRIYKDPNGKVVDKVVPLILSDVTEAMEDHSENAPVNDHGQLTKLRFDWSFNNDELMINILNQDYEVNKQSIYVTVRDVEDLNGNPMVSPITWTAFVDRNSLKWSTKKLDIKVEDQADTDLTTNVDIINQSGKRHTYTIESLPSWLTLSSTYGAIDPTEEQTVQLTFNSQIAVGKYDDIVYLTDEDGLSEPLHIEYEIEAIPPYDDIDEHKYPYNMSVCAQVKIDDAFDTDERDIVYAFYRNECVGMEHVAFDDATNKSKVYLTVYGNEDMNRKAIRFQLWQASTGKLFDLTANKSVLFAHGYVYNCGGEDPLILSTSGNEAQSIELKAGWNWISTYMDLTATKGALNDCMTANEHWSDGDLIKNPNTRQFSTYNESNDSFVGTLTNLHPSQMYMVNVQADNIVRIAGAMLSEDSMHVSVRGDGQWSVMPCLFDQTTALTEALGDYYQNASEGDLIKARNRFATFTEDKRWEGNLTALRPGEGYLFRRMGKGAVDISFYRQTNNVPRRVSSAAQDNRPEFTNPRAATNMTMIARVNGENGANDANDVLKVYVNDELVGVAEPYIIPSLSTEGASSLSEASPLYFLTIQCDRVGELRFEMNGQTLMPFDMTSSRHNVITYQADAHYGSIKAPIILKPTGDKPYKIIENNHVIIIRNNEKYDVTGKKL